MSDGERGRRWFETVRCGKSVDVLVVVKWCNLENRRKKKEKG